MPRKKVAAAPKKTELEKVTDQGAEAVDLNKLNEALDLVETTLGEAPTKLKQGAEFNFTYVDIATRLAAAGIKEDDIAFILGVKGRVMKSWKRKVPLFKQALQDGRRLAKSYLIAQGLRAAAGYDYVEKNVKWKTKVLEDGTTVRYPAEVSEYHKHQAPNPQLLMFMLCNMSRQLDEGEDIWTSAHKIDVHEQKDINVTISGKMASDQINKLAGKLLEQEGRKAIESKVIDE